ncbi:uncharacterized protein LOC135707744 [Ochlerotatus camptorhynchus]|uniref:uncharacterized protein LOC135707744 n=1 Tax=Ochlerotatus camptorhynchus TaxID=644619 RepID=UPI0031DEC010
MGAFSKCLDFRKNIHEIGKCCLLQDWLPERSTENCTNQHKFQFTESPLGLVMVKSQFYCLLLSRHVTVIFQCVHACYYRSLGVVDEFHVDLSRIQQLNVNRSQYELETINKAAFTCYNDKYEEIYEELMRFRTDCNSYPYLYNECIKNEFRMHCHEKLWRKSPVCDQFRANDIC